MEGGEIVVRIRENGLGMRFEELAQECYVCIRFAMHQRQRQRQRQRNGELGRKVGHDCSGATYQVACPQGRTYQSRYGDLAFGALRGERIRSDGVRDTAVMGIGSIHIRLADGKGARKAALLPGPQPGGR